MMSIRTKQWKYLHIQGVDGDHEAIYDLTTDPEEQTNLVDSDSPLLEDFRDRRETIESSRQELRVDRRQVDDEAIRRLKSLGYIQ